jgi:hypothetical protein
LLAHILIARICAAFACVCGATLHARGLQDLLQVTLSILNRNARTPQLWKQDAEHLQSLVLLSIAVTDRANILIVAIPALALGDQNKANALFLQE